MTAVSHSELSLSLEMKSIMTVSDKPWGERKTLCACVKITVDLVMSSKALYACEHVRILSLSVNCIANTCCPHLAALNISYHYHISSPILCPACSVLDSSNHVTTEDYLIESKTLLIIWTSNPTRVLGLKQSCITCWDNTTKPNLSLTRALVKVSTEAKRFITNIYW